jgi:acyl-CoA thioesterase-1
MGFRALLLLVLLAATTAARGVADTPVIMVLGDSLSAAYGIDRESGWVKLLQDRLDGAGYAYRIVNASVGGDTTRTALGRLPHALAQHKPRIVIVALGGNDGLRGLSLTDMRENLAAIIRESRAGDARVLLVGVRMPPNYGPVYTSQFSAVYADLARELKVPLVPFLLEGVAANPALMQEDGIHPVAAAQRRLLDNVWAQLQPLLDAQPDRALRP